MPPPPLLETTIVLETSLFIEHKRIGELIGRNAIILGNGRHYLERALVVFHQSRIHLVNNNLLASLLNLSGKNNVRNIANVDSQCAAMFFAVASTDRMTRRQCDGRHDER